MEKNAIDQMNAIKFEPELEKTKGYGTNYNNMYGKKICLLFNYIVLENYMLQLVT